MKRVLGTGSFVLSSLLPIVPELGTTEPYGGANAGYYAKAEESSMSETVNQVNPQAAGAANPAPAAAAAAPAAVGVPAAPTAAAPVSAAQRTFTQEGVNRIVADRLNREAAKYADYDAVKNELATLKASNAIRDIREKVAGEKKVPASLLTGDTEEACRQQADAILAFAGTAQTGSAPTVPDGGEVHTTPGGSTRDQFAEWFQSALGN